MKKTLSILVCICVLFASFAPLAAAASINDGKDALVASFLDGKCPDAYDYVYYEPKGAQDSSAKYPLVVWLHGNRSGDYPRQQIISHDFSKWASDEYQSRFADAGGAYLLLPRSSNGKWSVAHCSNLKETIDYYIAQNKDHIDTSRIYILGYSSGGSMVNHMIAAYPTFFAAAVPICSLYVPNPIEIALTKNVSVWYFASVFDIYFVSGALFARYEYAVRSLTTSRPEGVRITTFSTAVWADGSKDVNLTTEHKIWGAVTNDMHMNDGSVYAHQSTSEASGKAVSFDDGTGIIDWLSHQTNAKG